jgi:hypothetical protein
MSKPEKKKVSIDDPRFKKAESDPRFRKVSKKQFKVNIDSRFQGMFNDKRFQVTGT